MSWNIAIIVVYAIGCAMSFSNIIYMSVMMPILSYVITAIIIHLIKIGAYILGIYAGASGRDTPENKRKIYLLVSTSITMTFCFSHMCLFTTIASYRMDMMNPGHGDYNPRHDKHKIIIENIVHSVITIVLFITDLVGFLLCLCACVDNCPLRKSLISKLTEIPYASPERRPTLKWSMPEGQS